GTVDLGSNAALWLVMDSAPSPVNTVYTIINNDGSDAVLGTFNGLAQGGQGWQSFNGTVYDFTISYIVGTGNDVTLTYTGQGSTSGLQLVPEPSSIPLLGFASMSLLRRRRRAESKLE